jgi:hypothetical protein
MDSTIESPMIEKRDHLSDLPDPLSADDIQKVIADRQKYTVAYFHNQKRTWRFTLFIFLLFNVALVFSRSFTPATSMLDILLLNAFAVALSIGFTSFQSLAGGAGAAGLLLGLSLLYGVSVGAFIGLVSAIYCLMFFWMAPALEKMLQGRSGLADDVVLIIGGTDRFNNVEGETWIHRRLDFMAENNYAIKQYFLKLKGIGRPLIWDDFLQVRLRFANLENAAMAHERGAKIEAVASPITSDAQVFSMKKNPDVIFGVELFLGLVWRSVLPLPSILLLFLVTVGFDLSHAQLGIGHAIETGAKVSLLVYAIVVVISVTVELSLHVSHYLGVKSGRLSKH